ncbi:MAG: hypothetical protein BJ554DRAFT_1550, partial [Olpidium bornovanus]
MLALGLMEMPPLSNVTPFPTRARGDPSPPPPPPPLYRISTKRGGRVDPAATERSRRMFRSRIQVSSRTKTSTPCRPPTAFATVSAKSSGVARFEGISVIRRAKFWASAYNIPVRQLGPSAARSGPAETWLLVRAAQGIHKHVSCFVLTKRSNASGRLVNANGARPFQQTSYPDKLTAFRIASRTPGETSPGAGRLPSPTTATLPAAPCPSSYTTLTLPAPPLIPKRHSAAAPLSLAASSGYSS